MSPPGHQSRSRRTQQYILPPLLDCLGFHSYTYKEEFCMAFKNGTNEMGLDEPSGQFWGKQS